MSDQLRLWKKYNSPSRNIYFVRIFPERLRGGTPVVLTKVGATGPDLTPLDDLPIIMNDQEGRAQPSGDIQEALRDLKGLTSQVLFEAMQTMSVVDMDMYEVQISGADVYLLFTPLKNPCEGAA